MSHNQVRPCSMVLLALTLLGMLAPLPARALSDAQLDAAAKGIETRRDAMLAKLAGTAFKPARKQEPLSPGRGLFVRSYGYSVTDFAMKTFLLGESPAPANAALAEMCRFYSGDRLTRNDQDSFYWNADVTLRLIEFYGRAGSRAPGRMDAATEDAALEMFWLWAKENSRLKDAEIEKSQTWDVWESENHHVQRFATAWQISKLLAADPRWRDRPYDDGATAARHLAAWTAYAKRYLLERARKSLFVEVANGGYGAMTLKGIYNIYDFAPDPELRRRAGLLLNLYWATWAEEQLGGVRGGGKTRIYPGPASLSGASEELAHQVWLFFGLGQAAAAHGCDFTVMTSGWRPPSVVLDLALDPAGRGIYEVRQWPLGLAKDGLNNAPDYRLRTDDGGLYRYSWCTPEFILGTLLSEARPREDWTAISAQNRWQGAIFAGDPAARIFPQVRAKSRNRAYNQHWSAQRRGTLITQKLKAGAGTAEMRVWISNKGLTHRIERGGWVFVEAPGAYAAVRPAAGGYTWQAEEIKAFSKAGEWLTLKDAYAPVILEVARKSDFKDYGAFQEKVLGNPIKFEKRVLDYTGLGGDRFTFFADTHALPRINGKAVELKPEKAFDSPFIQSPRDSGVVTIKKDGRTLTLDFN